MFDNLVEEISQNEADLIKSFAIFYLLLVGNHVGTSIFTCFQIEYLQKHKLLQRLIAFLVFYFLVTIVSDTGNLKFTPPIEKFFYSILYFMGFLIVMRLDMRIFALVLVLIFTIYFLELNKKFYLDTGNNINKQIDKYIYNSNRYWITFNWPFKIRLFKVRNEDFRWINQIEKIIYHVILFLLVIGFIAYKGEIHESVKKNKNLNWIDVIGDTDICRLKDRKPFLHYLQVGLGVKI